MPSSSKNPPLKVSCSDVKTLERFTQEDGMCANTFAQLAGIIHRQTEQDKSYYYLEMEPLFAQGKIQILDHPELARELRLLERRPELEGKS
jgi:aminoglycoside/choline kinase family phosphotransferase